VARMEAERRAAQKAARKRRVIITIAVVVGVVALMALISVLGGDDDGGEDATTTTAPETTTTTAPEKPDVTVPETPPPTELQSTDLTVGDGAEAQPGSTVQVHYAGRAYSNGEEFDSSYDRPEAFSFTIGDPNILEGWHQGIVGMREGGRRQLVIPAALGYGEQGDPPDIGPNDTLVFVIDLLKVEEPPEPLPPPAPPAPPGG
jgi:peptidylprolyl isomerase